MSNQQTNARDRLKYIWKDENNEDFKVSKHQTRVTLQEIGQNTFGRIKTMKVLKFPNTQKNKLMHEICQNTFERMKTMKI